MLDYQDAVFGEQVMHEYHVWEFGNFLKDVWGISKDDVKLAMAGIDVFKCVTSDNDCVGILQFIQESLYKTAMQCFFFNTYYV